MKVQMDARWALDLASALIDEANSALHGYGNSPLPVELEIEENGNILVGGHGRARGKVVRSRVCISDGCDQSNGGHRSELCPFHFEHGPVV